ncbi:DUF3217 domain-containing protein [[Mycoplasma] testudinis]|uniref:DUF3217 domain-containing protein n=1 Tax=[Mycoplasma] testudinis TaxID=33924 RepID=UPI000485949E|nr:DUF3217 domain-containing protein [[Mycoplasma] testudinis]
MLNKVIIEGSIISSRWSSTGNGFFVSIRQTRSFGRSVYKDNFTVYANKPLAFELEKYVHEYETITVEGELRTYQDHKTKQWKTAIEIKKILIDGRTKLINDQEKTKEIK